jgi:hypothetical protein
MEVKHHGYNINGFAGRPAIFLSDSHRGTREPLRARRRLITPYMLSIGMLTKTLKLKADTLVCSTCTGKYFVTGKPRVCPYMEKFMKEFGTKRGWERKHYYPEVIGDEAVCSLIYRKNMPVSGLATIEATFRTRHTPYAKECTLHVKVSGGSAEIVLPLLGDMEKL